MSFTNYKLFRIVKASATSESRNEKTCQQLADDNTLIISHHNTNTPLTSLFWICCINIKLV